jgi:hypothetical protein
MLLGPGRPPFEDGDNGMPLTRPGGDRDLEHSSDARRRRGVDGVQSSFAVIGDSRCGSVGERVGGSILGEGFLSRQVIIFCNKGGGAIMKYEG